MNEMKNNKKYKILKNVSILIFLIISIICTVLLFIGGLHIEDSPVKPIIKIKNNWQWFLIAAGIVLFIISSILMILFQISIVKKYKLNSENKLKKKV